MNKLKNIVYILIVSFMCLVCMGEAALNCLVLVDINTDDCLTYEGNYIWYYKDYYHNTNYIVELENGDILEILPEYIKDGGTFKNSTRALFKYSKQPSLVKRGRRVPIHIVSCDESIVFLDENFVKSNILQTIILFTIIGLALLGVLMFPIVSNIVIQKNNSNKRRRKSGKQ